MFVLVTGLGAVIIAVTICFTASNYARLPERMPIHFGLDGKANSFGPRWTAWLFVGLQVLIAAAFAALYVANDIRIGRLILGNAVVGALAWGHYQVVTAAVNGTNRIHAVPFWAGFGALLVTGILAAVATR